MWKIKSRHKKKLVKLFMKWKIKMWFYRVTYFVVRLLNKLVLENNDFLGLNLYFCIDITQLTMDIFIDSDFWFHFVHIIVLFFSTYICKKFPTKKYVFKGPFLNYVVKNLFLMKNLYLSICNDICFWDHQKSRKLITWYCNKFGAFL